MFLLNKRYLIYLYSNCILSICVNFKLRICLLIKPKADLYHTEKFVSVFFQLKLDKMFHRWLSLFHGTNRNSGLVPGRLTFFDVDISCSIWNESESWVSYEWSVDHHNNGLQYKVYNMFLEFTLPTSGNLWKLQLNLHRIINYIFYEM